MANATPASNRADHFLGRKISPLTRRRLDNFRANKRGFWSLWIFLALFGLSLVAEVIANDKPILVYFDGAFFTPAFTAYPETAFGGEFETGAGEAEAVQARLGLLVGHAIGAGFQCLFGKDGCAVEIDFQIDGRARDPGFGIEKPPRLLANLQPNQGKAEMEGLRLFDGEERDFQVQIA